MSDDRDEAPDASAAAERRTIAVGLLCDPGLPSDVVTALAGSLEAQLSESISGNVDWSVRVRTEPLRITQDGKVPIMNLAKTMLPEHGWDLLICVTDLPRLFGDEPVVADLSVSHSVALVSLPALGVWRMRKRLRETLIYLVAELSRGGALGFDMDRGRHPAGGKLAPVRWVDHPDSEIETAMALVGTYGRFRLLAGMVRDNKPWRLVPELSTALAAGFGIAAFGIFYSSIWQLADALSGARLTLISVLAVAAMLSWLIGYNRLWESRSSPRGKALLYNLSTVFSLLIGVVASYAVLFTVTFAGANAVIEGGYLEQTLGHPVNFTHYLKLSWLSSSMGTVAGALGSSLESEEAVYRAAYSRRERQRRRLDRQMREREAREQGGE